MNDLEKFVGRWVQVEVDEGLWYCTHHPIGKIVDVQLGLFGPKSDVLSVKFEREVINQYIENKLHFEKTDYGENVYANDDFYDQVLQAQEAYKKNYLKIQREKTSVIKIGQACDLYAEEVFGVNTYERIHYLNKNINPKIHACLVPKCPFTAEKFACINSAGTVCILPACQLHFDEYNRHALDCGITPYIPPKKILEAQKC